MGTPNSDLLLSAEALGLGETARIQCPSCGRSTLSVTKQEDGSVVWNCYRASCEERGGRGGGHHYSKHERPRPRKQRFTPFTGELAPLTEEQEEHLLSLIGWTAEHRALSRVRFAPEEARYAFPIFSPMGVRRGYVLRDYAPDAYLKALTRMESEEPHMSWYGGTHGRQSTVIVEDIPSAVRAALYVQSCAINGTGVGPEYAMEIAAHSQRVTWMLDADATVLAIRHHNKYRGLFEESRVHPIRCDLKNMPEEELKELLI